MNYLLLIRHSIPDIRANIPADRWGLSLTGRACSETLARRLEVYSPQVMITSMESKSIETGEIIAGHFGIESVTAQGLHEHVRDNVGYLELLDFEKRLAAFFSQPEKLMLGRETANQALGRFSTALEKALTRFPSGNIAVVTHGTVLTLWVTRITGENPLPFWKRLGMPALLVFSRPDLQLLEQIDHVK